jgi:hypothetical protein
VEGLLCVLLVTQCQCSNLVFESEVLAALMVFAVLDWDESLKEV